MKKIISVIILMLVSAQVFARNDEALVIKNTSIKKVNSNVVVTFEIGVDDFAQNHKVLIIPVIYNDNKSTVLETLTLIGKKKMISDNRAGIDNGDYRIIKRNEKEYVVYAAAVPYEPWMQRASLSVSQTREGCNCGDSYPEEVLADNKLLYYELDPTYNKRHFDYELSELEKYDLENPFLHAMEDYNKRYDILVQDRDRNTSKVIFKVGKADIDRAIPGNQQTLDAITKAFEVIKNDPNAVLKHIVIAGYASPEGPLSTNTRLAQQRAEVVKKFIQLRMDSPRDEIFELCNGREDWGGLREMVQNSSMEDKAEIMEIIDGYTMEQEVRKTKLKQFKDGAPYKYMLENFYPALRTGGYVQVYYEIDRRATIPAAVTDSQGRMVWVDPDSHTNRSVTAINKAIDKMVEKKFDEALDLMLEFEDDSRSWNYIGVCYMMKGDYDRANKYFAQAVEAGNADAAENMRQIGILKTIE